MSSMAMVIGGCMSSLALGWILGKSIKTIRQFFDAI